ncbi:MAG: Co/Zn/Cd efflux system rane fusion protein [Chitinophagaceae bacterium]|nr:Co/Zn/Cd efflux system rane fusion protein [Chitinophagaceae bacterium]
MKTVRHFSILLACFIMTISVSAQKVKTESFKVSGECGMCKKKIESAARQAGATHASWSPETKVLKVTYNVNGGGISAIRQTIANSGYDTPGYKAPEEAYNSLDECCKYPREVNTAAPCCSGKEEMKDSKCAELPVCQGKDCCKKS